MDGQKYGGGDGEDFPNPINTLGRSCEHLFSKAREESSPTGARSEQHRSQRCFTVWSLKSQPRVEVSGLELQFFGLRTIPKSLHFPVPNQVLLLPLISDANLPLYGRVLPLPATSVPFPTLLQTQFSQQMHCALRRHAVSI